MSRYRDFQSLYFTLQTAVSGVSDCKILCKYFYQILMPTITIKFSSMQNGLNKNIGYSILQATFAGLLSSL